MPVPFHFCRCHLPLSLSSSHPHLLHFSQSLQFQKLSIQSMAMRLVVLIALCVLPALVSARPAKTDFIVQGRVYCDTCQAGFETSATTYIHGARVMVKCRDIKSDKTTYSCEGVTDETGTYKIPISGDHENEICETVLVSSPQQGCATVAPGRDRARLALTHNNGIVSDNRYANNMGFMKDAPLAGCTDLLKQYQEFDG